LNACDSAPDLYSGTAQNSRKSAVKDTKPNTVSICVLLARGDHVAGVLLERISYWSRYGKATIPDVEGHWCANNRRWWMREAYLSPGQLDRSIAKLVELGLIEKRQYPFAGRNVLHMRPNTLTSDILASAKTWGMALEVLAHAGIPTPKGLAEPGTQVMPSLPEMAEAWGKEHLTAEEVGKLALYRHEMNDDNEKTLPLIVWVVHHWVSFLAECKWANKNMKDAPATPSIAFFCDHFNVALSAAMKEVEEAA
jgi:hypothetical protein